MGARVPDLVIGGMLLATVWRLEMVVATSAKIPMLGTTRAEVLSTLAVTWTPTFDGVMQTQRVCSSHLNDRGQLVKTILPDAFIAALPSASFPIQLTEDARGWAYAADFGRQVVGWTGQGPLPTEASATSVTDWDADGKPGATVLIDAPLVGRGEVYVAQQGRTTVQGRTGPDGVITGTVTVHDFAQAVIGASSAMFARGPEVHSDPSRSWFRMVPNATCDPFGG